MVFFGDFGGNNVTNNVTNSVTNNVTNIGAIGDFHFDSDDASDADRC